MNTNPVGAAPAKLLPPNRGTGMATLELSRCHYRTRWRRPASRPAVGSLAPLMGPVARYISPMNRSFGSDGT